MKKSIIIILFIVSSLFSSQIKDYQVVSGSFFYQNSYYSFLRSFYHDKKKYFLVVDENSLKTKLFKLSDLKAIILLNNKKTRYKKLLKKYSMASSKLQNFGITSLHTKDVYLTADLCPSSKKGYEDRFIKYFIKRYYKNKPLKITFFVSGRWIQKHKKEFYELISFQKSKKLDITWGNHTFTHYYNPHLRFDKNFILKKGTNLKKEILKVEKILLENDVLPSILFRFPGLVSDKKSEKFINTLGLLPVGTNAWLAKNQNIHDGSVILIHGNKNEPLGIKKAIKIFKENDYDFGSILEDLKL
ncbi:polysaccharide deacetylase family protein [Arcobacter sp. CECT 8985]|uniref:polysaccharide deacetylase family protein n=1 Tax=Arcobacter sp. CECT 8985 TaxID=1935424 RepID=UPI00100C08EC|nr:polysaccharide deacetylase family protein [Arcobacter sp. CECT 8985]RXJ88072.1 hypothetical protein CRU93_00290 [Arcobacter sp. CECT 8985]